MAKDKIDTSGERNPLSASPFGQLAGRLKADDLPQLAAEAGHSKDVGERLAKLPYSVARTRKGGAPVFVEHRPGGKVVTVVRNVSGDTQVLLKMLKQRCGAGGTVREGAIEIQGDHSDRITELLRDALT